MLILPFKLSFSLALLGPLGDLAVNQRPLWYERRMRSLLLVFCLFFHATACVAEVPATPPVTQPGAVTRIAFGSCLQQRRPVPILDAVVAAEPDVFVMLGDNVYADSTNPEEIAAAYAELGAKAEWRRLRGAVPRLMAMWDDHDYGLNDMGREHPDKAGSQRVFLDWLGVAGDSPRREREGVYHSEAFGPEGRRVQVILLDTRYFRGPLERVARGRYVPSTAAEQAMLGEDQWAWLAERLAEPAEVRVIGSSIQVLTTQQDFEKWANLPRERERLLNLLDETLEDHGGTIVLISGDRHNAELSRLELPGGGVLYDLTSSSLNNSRGRPRGGEPNDLRVGDGVYADNFGVIDLDWEAATVGLSVRGVEGEVLLEEAIEMHKPADDG